MEREYKAFPVTLTNAEATTPAIALRDRFSAGKIYLPAGYASTALTFFTLDPATGDYLQEYEADGDAVSITIAASRAVPLPDQLFASSHFKIVTNNAADNSTEVGLVWRV